MRSIAIGDGVLVSDSTAPPVTHCTALGMGTSCSKSYTAVVRLPNEVIEFPTTGNAARGYYFAVPTADGTRHFVGPDKDGAFREIPAP